MPSKVPINPPRCIILRLANNLVCGAFKSLIGFLKGLNFAFYAGVKRTTPFKQFKAISLIALTKPVLAFFNIFLTTSGLEFANRINVFFALLILASRAEAMMTSYPYECC